MSTVPEVVPSVGDARAPEGRGRAGGGTGSPLVQRGGRAAGRGRCRRRGQPRARRERIARLSAPLTLHIFTFGQRVSASRLSAGSRKARGLILIEP